MAGGSVVSEDVPGTGSIAGGSVAGGSITIIWTFSLSFVGSW